MRPPVAAWLMVLALVSTGADSTPDQPRPRGAAVDAETAEVIVRFREDAALTRRYGLAARAPAEQVRATLAARAATIGARHRLAIETGSAVAPRVQVLRARGLPAEALAERLRADPDVESVAVNHRRRILAAPTDPLYPAVDPALRPSGPAVGQWALRAPQGEVRASIDVESAWDRTRGGGVVVAVLDTGVRFEHPDLGRAAQGGRLLPGYDFVSDPVVANDGGGRDGDPSDPGDWTTAAENSNPRGPFYDCDPDPAEIGAAIDTPSSWHGTRTASLVGAAAGFGGAPAVGMAGAAPRAQVLPVRVLGKCFGTDADIQAGMRWAAGLEVPGVPANPTPARVINLSLGGGGACGSYQEVVDAVRARGVTVVVAAGNSDGQAVAAPGNCERVVTVLGLRHVGTKVGFSDLGREITVAAPGGNCVNVDPLEPCLYPIVAATNRGLRGPAASAWTDSFDVSVGTSFASPLAAATASLMIAVRPDLNPATLASLLQRTARPFPQGGPDVPACRPPDGRPQLECTCPNDGSLCGAGMLDAGAAVAAATTVELLPDDTPQGGGGGGGAMSATWVAALALAAFALRRTRRAR